MINNMKVGFIRGYFENAWEAEEVDRCSACLEDQAVWGYKE